MHGPRPETIPVEMLLAAYRSGIFPMADSRDDPEIFWVEPQERAIIPLERFRLSTSLGKLVRRNRFRITVNAAFRDVVAACAAPRPDHPESWISNRISASYGDLHDAGYAHSVECWDQDGLAGGLYGVAFDRVFCGESMFSWKDNSSKVALAWLVALLRRGGFRLLDCQFMTSHLASLGAIAVTQERYRQLLIEARGDAVCSLRTAYSSLLDDAGASSPGKLIAQSLTQTS